MKFGFLCSAGGSPVFSALSILFKLNYIDKSDIKILTDRDSIALNTAVKNGIECRKKEWPGSQTGIINALQVAFKSGIDVNSLCFDNFIIASLIIS